MPCFELNFCWKAWKPTNMRVAATGFFKVQVGGRTGLSSIEVEAIVHSSGCNLEGEF